MTDNTYGFGVRRRLCNLDDLKEVGFKANRRLLDVQRSSHDCPIGVETFDAFHRPAVVDGRRVSAMRFGDPRIQAVTAALLMHVFLPAGFSNRQPGRRSRSSRRRMATGPARRPATCGGCA
ncbi:MAG: hypothetical protein F4X97_04490 [Boseongicola sp. SB0662_bin_57]|nr:hypothetical protein [Boseongicola sp. SB0662_bin_57]